MVRFVHIGISFAAVLCGYVAYSTLAVPLIEPPAEGPDSGAAASQGEELPSPESNRWRAAIAGLLPGANWPLERAKILASPQLQLVFCDYDTQDGGKTVRIWPCAIIYTPGGHADPPQDGALQQTVVLEAPEGATLEFDEPLSLSRMKVGRIRGGQLKGWITIRSGGKQPGPEDDLIVVTRNVQLTESRVWTSYPVDFRLGANHGRGQQMLIKLLGSEESAAGGKQKAEITGIESFEVRRLEQLHLEFGQRDSGSVQTADRRPAPIAADLPIEVSCQGPFRFEPMRQMVTFEDRVDVLQLHPDGPSDQIHCDLLSIHLARPRGAVSEPVAEPKAEAGQRRKAAWDLQPRRIEARGNPVVVTAASEGVEVRGQRLDYDFQSGRIVLDGTEEVFLKQGNNEIRARDLQYEPAAAGALGQVVARGPGRLTGQMDGTPPRQFQATWGKQLQIRPVDGQQVISLTGGAEADYGGMGGLAAAEIHFWLWESPPTGREEPRQLRPDRMLASGNVQLHSPQLSGNVEQVEVWFEQAEEPPNQNAADREIRDWGIRTGQELGPLGSNPQFPIPNLPNSSPPLVAVTRNQATVLPTTYAAGLQPIERPAPAHLGAAAAASSERFEIVGKLARGRMVVHGHQTELTELMIEGNVRLSEKRTSQPDLQPLVVSGNRIHMVDASQPYAAVTVSGAPAHFEGRGLGLSGATISLNRGTNRLWIDGPGQMDLPWQQDFQGQALSSPGSLAVHWHERMTFDGRTASFEGSVVATAPHQNLQTETLEVSLKTPIRFDQPLAGLPSGQGGPAVEPGRVRCHGGVFLESESLDGDGRASLEKMQLGDLDMNLASGETVAAGPGWMTVVRRGSTDLLGFSAAARPVALRPAENGADNNQLSYLSVRFRGSIAGNLHQREMTFHDKVRTVYGPVDSWDATFDSEDLESLGPRGVLLSCEQLKVSQMPDPRRQRSAVELEATGSVMVEGQTFTARAVRMTYAEAKDLLILEGDGRTDAQLYYQQYVGAPYAQNTAQQIWYWPSTHQVQLHGVKLFEWNQLPGGLPGKGK